MAWVSLCDLDELTEGVGKHMDIDGFALAVYLHQSHVYVLDATCPHAGHDISAGGIDDGCAVCPFHGWSFRLTTGEMPGAPGIAVRTYPTRLYNREGKPPLVQVNLPTP